MSVLIYADHSKGHFKKGAFEAVTYAAKVAKMLGTECVALVIGKAEGLTELSNYGATKILQLDNDKVTNFDSQVYASAISTVATQQGASVVVVPHNANGKSLLGRLSVRLNAGSVSGVNSLPTIDAGRFVVSKSVFSGKAVANYEIKSATKLLSLMGNSIKPEAVGGSASVEQVSVDLPASKVKVLSVKTVEGIVPLPEADLVVSAGRGMKGPENWGIVEELASVLGATTACSRPVADAHWRPHHEHVGQTGVAIRPNLYIAIGISGAIQHLAGVNNSKTIVVINKDAEAPFFKAADYGVCGDLFEIVPKFTAALKAFKHDQ